MIIQPRGPQHKHSQRVSQLQLEDTQSTLNEFRNKYQALTQDSRNRLGLFNTQISKLNETVSDLRKQLKEVIEEKEKLANQSAPSSVDLSSVEIESLQTQLSAAKAEKEVTEKLLAEESAKLAKTVVEHQAVLVHLQF